MFRGRVDGQVKVRGHRIETGEIEALLEQHPAVTEAAVVLRNPDDPIKCHLKAYVASQATDRELRRWLVQHLPDVMVPQKIEVVPVLPRTTAGKVDRVALAER
ncbi:AMP-binding enzyme [Parafrankia colletiae]|uniref:AMP-binding enzyme n=1 Tax=Parafrankia colletiae TaxID=573497 RepID=UPI0038992B74